MEDNLNSNQPTEQNTPSVLEDPRLSPNKASHPENQSVPRPAEPAASQAQSTSGLAIAGMVLGIVALVTIPLPFINFGSPLLAIIGLVLSIVGFNGIKKGKRKGKGIAVAGIVLCAIVTVCALLVSAACSAAVSAKDSSSASSAVTSSNSNAENTAGVSKAQSSESAAAGNAEASFVGTWDMTRAKDGKTDYSEEELKAYREAGKDSYLALKEDGTGTLVIGSSKSAISWEVTSASEGVIKEGSSTYQLTLEDGTLAIRAGDASYMSFEKGEERTKTTSSSSDAGSRPSASTSAEPSSSDLSSSEVSPDLKEVLDSYEAFIDEYIEFMEKYQESDDTSGMLQNYTEFMQRYADYMQKIEKMDASDMSSADYAYYIEVTSRVSKKLLEASGV